jgi:heme exporter protein A
VEHGEVVGIVGHNGCGKSTLLKIVSTALRPTSGSVAVYGHSTVTDANAVRRVCALLTHHHALYDDLTARENLEFAAAMLGVATARARYDEVLERVGLRAEADERVRGFSSGMQRRLGLARMLLQQPRLLLMDEPYNSLDSEGVELVNEIIRERVRAGSSALVVLHDPERAASVLDRLFAMNRGRASDERAPGQAALAASGGVPR